MTELLGNTIKNSKGIELKIDKVFAGSNYYIYNLKFVDNTDSGLLLKEIPFLKERSYRELAYEKEVHFLSIASSLDVSPKLVHHEIISKEKNGNLKRFGIIIFEKYGEGTLTKLYKDDIMQNPKYLNSIRRQVKIILKKLYDNNINHNDLHTDNFLYHYDSEKDKYNIKIIDFDLSKPINSNNKRNYKVRIIGPNTFLNVSNEMPRNTRKNNSSRNKTSKNQRSNGLFSCVFTRINRIFCSNSSNE